MDGREGHNRVLDGGVTVSWWVLVAGGIILALYISHVVRQIEGGRKALERIEQHIATVRHAAMDQVDPRNDAGVVARLSEISRSLELILEETRRRD